MKEQLEETMAVHNALPNEDAKRVLQERLRADTEEIKRRWLGGVPIEVKPFSTEGEKIEVIKEVAPADYGEIKAANAALATENTHLKSEVERLNTRVAFLEKETS